MHLPPFTAPWPFPEYKAHPGQFVILAPTDPDRDSLELFVAGHATDEARALWRFLTRGPFESEAAFRLYLHTLQERSDLLAYTVRRADDRAAVGMISIMRIEPAEGVAELGSIWYTPRVQRTAVNTETIYLLLKYLFEVLGYRRVEWKCDSENARSAAAARRLGFTEEGCFRQHMVVKGRSRDTLWFSMLDGEWSTRKACFEQTLYSGESVSLSALNARPR